MSATSAPETNDLPLFTAESAPPELVGLIPVVWWEVYRKCADLLAGHSVEGVTLGEDLDPRERIRIAARMCGLSDLPTVAPKSPRLSLLPWTWGRDETWRLGMSPWYRERLICPVNPNGSCRRPTPWPEFFQQNELALHGIGFNAGFYRTVHPERLAGAARALCEQIHRSTRPNPECRSVLLASAEEVHFGLIDNWPAKSGSEVHLRVAQCRSCEAADIVNACIANRTIEVLVAVDGTITVQVGGGVVADYPTPPAADHRRLLYQWATGTASPIRFEEDGTRESKWRCDATRTLQDWLEKLGGVFDVREEARIPQLESAGPGRRPASATPPKVTNPEQFRVVPADVVSPPSPALAEAPAATASPAPTTPIPAAPADAEGLAPSRRGRGRHR